MSSRSRTARCMRYETIIYIIMVNEMGVVVICYTRLCATKDKILITTKLRYVRTTRKNTGYVFWLSIISNISTFSD